MVSFGDQSLRLNLVPFWSSARSRRKAPSSRIFMRYHSILDFPAQSRRGAHVFSTATMSCCSFPVLDSEINLAQVVAQISVRRLSSALSGPAELAKQV